MNKSRTLRWESHVAKMEEGRSAFNIFTRTPTGKISLGKPRRRWEDNIRWILKKYVSLRRIWLILHRIGING